MRWFVRQSIEVEEFMLITNSLIQKLVKVFSNVYQKNYRLRGIYMTLLVDNLKYENNYIQLIEKGYEIIFNG